MKKAKFLTPVVTAFDSNGKLDIQSNKNIWDYLIKGGVDGLVIMGSTGEFFSMSNRKKKELIELAIDHINKRVKVYIGTACMDLEETIELSNFALEKGADAVMVISPYYFSLSNESIEFFYDKVAESVNGNIYLYNFPDRTGYDLNPDVALKIIRKHKNIVGFKDTVIEMGHTRKLITTILDEFPDFEIFSGFDENFIHNILSGGSGCIGGLSNLYPELFSSWVNAINNEDLEKVFTIQKKVDKLMDLYSVGTPFIATIKKSMVLRGIDMKDYCKKPLLESTDKETQEIERIMKEAGIL